MKKLPLLLAALLPFLAQAQTVTLTQSELDTKPDVYRGTAIIIRDVSSHQACLDAITADAMVRKSASTNYTCRTSTAVTAKYSAVVVPPEPPAATWSKCADERKQCVFTGRRQVRYGDGVSAWIVRIHEGGVLCDNSIFSDPAVGVLKRCEVSSLTTTDAVSPPLVVEVPEPEVPPVVTPPASGTRDVFKQPFASNSIWNVSIGSGAIYVPTGMSAVYSDPWASFPYADEDVIILKPTAPATPIRQGSWAGDRCSPISGTVYATVPIPTNYTIGSSNHNLASAVLAADGRTLVNIQPFTRCTAGQPATAIVRWPDSDLYGDGIDGAHGGSGMSSVGGTLRVGELRPGSQGVPHVLKLIVNMQEAFKCTSYAACYRWPAKAADGYAVGRYGASKAGPTGFKMGALLAIPASVDITKIGLQTEPGKQIAWTLQNYGGYVVDDSYGGQFGIATETGPDGSFIQQFASDYGFGFPARQNATGAQAGWVKDIQALVRLLHIVDNNSVTAVGGGGTARRPAAPAVSP